MDHTGNFAVACPAAKKPRGKSHSRFEHTVLEFAGRAGISGQRNPETFDLLQRLIPNDQLAQLFPAQATKASKQPDLLTRRAIEELAKARTASEIEQKRAR